MTNFRMTAISRLIAAGTALAALAILPGCVDNDYDLSKDMDLNVTIGTDGLTLPGSSTQMLSLDNLFDLGDNSSIKTIEADDEHNYGLNVGDYVLVQASEGNSSTINIPKVEIDDIAGSEAEFKLTMYVEPDFQNASSNTEIFEIPNIELSNTVDLNATDVTSDIVSLTNATTNLEVNVKIHLNVTNYTGKIYLMKGFSIKFPEFWTVELAEGSSSELSVKEDNCTISFNSDFNATNNDVTLNIKITNFNFRDANGQGLFQDDDGVNTFRISDSVKLYGKLGLERKEATPGQSIDITMKSIVEPDKAELLSVSGIVNPKIDIDETDFQINDIPDFLAEDGNHLDLYNPQLYFTVNNQAPVGVSFSAILTPLDDKGNVIKNEYGEPNIIYIGKAYTDHGTEENPVPEINIKEASENKICICRKLPDQEDPSVTYITIGKLSDLFMTIPSRVTITGITAVVPEEEFTIELGTTYEEKYDYEAVIPFVFGKGTTIKYMTSSEDLDTEDFDKFNFESVELSFNAVNGLPMNLTPKLEVKDEGDRILTDVTCEVTETIAAATAAGPSTSKITAVLTSTAENLSKVKKISASFTAYTDDKCDGVALNKNQGVKFTDITATLKGDIDIDLND